MFLKNSLARDFITRPITGLAGEADTVKEQMTAIATMIKTVRHTLFDLIMVISPLPFLGFEA
jgi:hypothetical protein